MSNSPKNCDYRQASLCLVYEVPGSKYRASCMYFFIILCIMLAKDVIYICRILCVFLEEDQRSESICSWNAGIHFGLCRSGVVQCCRRVLCLWNSTHIL